MWLFAILKIKNELILMHGNFIKLYGFLLINLFCLHKLEGTLYHYNINSFVILKCT